MPVPNYRRRNRITGKLSGPGPATLQPAILQCRTWFRLSLKSDCRLLTACASFPRELLAWPSRSRVERIRKVRHRNEMPRRGHIAAMEEAQLPIDDIQSFTRVTATGVETRLREGN